MLLKIEVSLQKTEADNISEMKIMKQGCAMGMRYTWF